MIGSGLGIGFFSRFRRGRSVSIDAIIRPATSPLTAGQSLSDTPDWDSFLAVENYVSSEPIASVTVGYIGSTSDATSTLADGDINQFNITVTNTAGTSRIFNTVPRLVLFDVALNTALPNLSGSTGLGDTITTTNGTWTGASGGLFSYQWLRDDEPITDAVSSTYTITLEDSAANLRSRVTYTNSGGAASASSNPIVIDQFTAPAITGVPIINGDALVGQTLTAMPADVENGGTRTWQWFASGVAIDGAISDTYQLTPFEENTSITVRQTQTNGFGVQEATSAATGPVTYAAPVTSTPLSDQVFTDDTGIQTYDTGFAFTGQNITFSVTGPTGVTVDEAGILSFDTDSLGPQTETSISVRASNSGGFVDSDFNLSVAPPPAPTISIVPTSVTVPYGTAAGSTLATISTGGTGTLSLSGDDASLFEIAGNVLRNVSDLNFAALRTVTAHIENTGGTDSASFALTVEATAPTYTPTLGALLGGQTFGQPGSGADVEAALTGSAGVPAASVAWEYNVNGEAFQALSGTPTANVGQQIQLRISDNSHPSGAFSAQSIAVVVMAGAVWEITGQRNALQISAKPDVMVPTVVGGAEEITITG